MVLHGHLRSNVSTGPFLALHRAATALLAADDAHNKMWKRLVPFVKSPAGADFVIEHLIKHLIEQMDPRDKKRMEAFITHAMLETLHQRVANGTAKAADARLYYKTWDRIEGKEV